MTHTRSSKTSLDLPSLNAAAAAAAAVELPQGKKIICLCVFHTMRTTSFQQCTFFLLFLLLAAFQGLVPVLAQDTPSCLEYSKGEYSGNVTSAEDCRTACETAEGLPEPDFKTSTCTTDGDDAVNYKCDCKKCDSSNANCERRSLCEDTPCSGGAGTGSGRIGLVVGMGMMATFMLV